MDDLTIYNIREYWKQKRQALYEDWKRSGLPVFSYAKKIGKRQPTVRKQLLQAIKENGYPNETAKAKKAQ